MLTKIRYILKQKGQGIVEYAMLLGVIVVLGVMLTSSGIGDSVTDTFDSVVALFGGETKTAKLDIKKAGKNQLHNYITGDDIVSDALRIQHDQEALANIGAFFIGMTRSQVRAEIGTTKGEILLVDYVDNTEAGSGDTGGVEVRFDKDVTKGHLDNWMQGDYGDGNGNYSDGNSYSTDTRYLLSNSMIEHRDAEALAATDNYGWGNNRSIRIEYTYSSSTGGNPTGKDSDIVTGARVRINRGNSKIAGTHYHEFDITVKSDKTWSQTYPGQTGAY